MFLWYSTCSRPRSTAHSTAQGLRGVELAHQLLGGRAAPPGLELVHIHEPPRRDIRATNPGRGIGAKEIDIIIPRRQEASSHGEPGTTGFHGQWLW